ncbi:MAG: hypothetical protein JJD98_16365 [Polaromonas sp.]|nr:hypothetical protein [Polaromonas sp.]
MHTGSLCVARQTKNRADFQTFKDEVIAEQPEPPGLLGSKDGNVFKRYAPADTPARMTARH